MLVIALAVGVVAGCSSGTPPSQIPVKVVGAVLMLDTKTGVQGVNIQLEGAAGKFPPGGPAVTGADGKFQIEDVLAPADYAIKVTFPEGSNLRVAGELRSVRVDASKAQNGIVQIGTIYATLLAPPPEYK